MVSIICPNRNLDEWKALVDGIGEERAYLSFFRSKNQIPTVETARQLLGIEAPKSAQPTPKPLTTLEALSQSKQVKVKLPEGANQLRITTSDGKRAIETIRNLNKGANPFYGVQNITKIEAGVTGVSGANKGKFLPVKGDVLAEAREAPEVPAHPEQRMSIPEEPQRTGMSESELQSVIDSIVPNARYIFIVDDPSVRWSGLTEDYGKWKQLPGHFGTITLNRANIYSPDMAREVLFEEMFHSVWGAPELRDEVAQLEAMVTEAMRQRMGQIGYDPKYRTEEAAVDILNDIRAKLESQPWWKTLLLKLLSLIKRIFGVNLSPEEAAIPIIR